MFEKGRGTFNFGGSESRRAVAREALREQIAQMDFMGIACVISRPEYVKAHGIQPIDSSLPHQVYLMMMDFIAERIVIALDNHFGGAKARLIAESRGPLEDMLLQYEFARVGIDGTSYISGAWFRHQLCPGIDFQKKDRNSTGLQLPDLLARPCAEKVLDPSSVPDRWREFRDKLCPDRETEHSILGLKIVPWDEKYVDIWKS